MKCLAVTDSGTLRRYKRYDATISQITHRRHLSASRGLHWPSNAFSFQWPHMASSSGFSWPALINLQSDGLKGLRKIKIYIYIFFFANCSSHDIKIFLFLARLKGLNQLKLLGPVDITYNNKQNTSINSNGGVHKNYPFRLANILETFQSKSQ